jgi:hypothetical protein
MFQVGFEPTILVFERAKAVEAVHALDRATTVIGGKVSYMGVSEKPGFFLYK